MISETPLSSPGVPIALRLFRSDPVEGLLLTWGIDDFAFPRVFMERFREDFRIVTTQRLDAKHYIQEDAPGEIATAIEGFLSGPAARP